MAFFNNNTNKEGTYFVAYCGKRIEPFELNRAMDSLKENSKYTVKHHMEVIDNPNSKNGLPSFSFREGFTKIMYMAKIVPTGKDNCREPYVYGSLGDEVWNVAAYDQDELSRIYKNCYSDKYPISDSDFYHSLLNQLFMEKGLKGLKELAIKQIHFCTAIANIDKSMNKYELIGYATTPVNEYEELFFGLPDPSEPNDVLITNSIAIVKRFCPNAAYQLAAHNTIMDGEIYDLDGNRVPLEYGVVPGVLSSKGFRPFFSGDTSTREPNSTSSEPTKIDNVEPKKEEPSSNTDNSPRKTILIDSITSNNSSNGNSSPNPVDNTNRDKTISELERKMLLEIMTLVQSEETKKLIRKVIDGETSEETKNKIREIIENELKNDQIEEIVSKRVSEIVDKKIEELEKKVQIPKVNIIKLNDVEIGRVEGEHFHYRFKDILDLVQINHPVMLIGPAGAGKNHTIGQVGKALNKELGQDRIYYTNCASNEFKLTGFTDAGGTYRDTEFYRAFKNGGIFFLDEIDNSDPSSLIVLNSALANGYMSFPHETIDRHKNFRMVAAANTFGKGSDVLYVGRNALDASTLDRFESVFFDYDKELERKLYPSKDLLDFMWAFREAVAATRTRHIVSTRGIGRLYEKELNGIRIELGLETNVVKDLSQDDLNLLIKEMENKVSEKNKYFVKLKKYEVGR